MPTHFTFVFVDNPSINATEVYISNDDVPERPVFALVDIIHWKDIVWC